MKELGPIGGGVCPAHPPPPRSTNAITKRKQKHTKQEQEAHESPPGVHVVPFRWSLPLYVQAEIDQCKISGKVIVALEAGHSRFAWNLAVISVQHI